MRLALAVLALVLLHAHEARAAVFSCDEPGVLAAIAAGGGPHTFSCPGPTTIVTSAELVISQSVELDGGGLLTLSGGGTHRVIHVDIASDAVVGLRNLVLRDGVAPNPIPVGGWVYTGGDHLIVDGVEVHGCEGFGGGGIYTETLATTVVDSTLRGNQGGGIRAQAGAVSITRSRIRDNAGIGVSAGITASNTSLAITDSSIEGNTGAGIDRAYGGSLVISRSTISHNGDSGLVFSGGTPSTIEDSTFVGNLPVAMLFAQPPFPASDVHIRNSSVIGNAGVASAVLVGEEPPPGPHNYSYDAIFESSILVGGCTGDTLDDGGNLATHGSCPGTLVTAAQLNLGTLGPHGGPTWTVPLKAPSLAIDVAPGCTAATDQRGVARPFGAACDIGAFEWDGPLPGAVPALPWLGVAALFAALCVAGLWSLRGRRRA